MKKGLALFLIFNLYLTCSAQDFTWMKGSNQINTVANYGTQGVSAPSNNPGSRHGCAKWTDAAGNLWLFGGEGLSTTNTLCWLNDLWKYNVATNEWTWIRGSNGPNANAVFGTLGVSAPTNEPGAREFSVSWTDPAGNFWMFGGDGFAVPTQTTAARLGDLWKYDPVTNEWTWMHGFNTVDQNGVYGTLNMPAAANMPGTRMGACGWADAAGNLWLFGGEGAPASGPQGRLNDLWKYSTATNAWTWISGSNLINQNGVYGTLGSPAPANAPGGRYFPNCWPGTSTTLYLFGGGGYDGAGSTGRLNDLWTFDTSTGQWTWINGANTINQSGVYGTQNVPSATNSPGGRFAAATWKDPYGNLWLFGGTGLATTMVTAALNDLFKYNPLTNMWTWVKGSNLLNQNGTYGTQGVTAAANVPGARSYNTMWTGNNGHLWLLGGEGRDASNTFSGNMNDLWHFRVPCNPDSITASPDLSFCAGIQPTLTAVNGGTNTTWYNSAVSTTSLASGQSFTFIPATVNTASVYTYFAEANSCTMIPRASISITVNPAPSLIATTSQTRACRGYPVVLTASGANTYTWNFTPPITSQTVSVVQGPIGTYTYVVAGTNTMNCSAVASVTVYFGECAGINEIKPIHVPHKVYPNPSNGEFTLTVENEFTKGTISFINALGEKVLEQQIYTNETQIKSRLQKGLYYYSLKLDDSQKASGKLVVD